MIIAPSNPILAVLSLLSENVMLNNSRSRNYINLTTVKGWLILNRRKGDKQSNRFLAKAPLVAKIIL
jgi:hypothetical protein